MSSWKRRHLRRGEEGGGLIGIFFGVCGGEVPQTPTTQPHNLRKVDQARGHLENEKARKLIIDFESCIGI